MAENEHMPGQLALYPCLLPIVGYTPTSTYLGRLTVPPVSPAELELVSSLDGTTMYEDLIRANPSFGDLSNFTDYLVWWDRPLKEEATVVERGGSLVISAHPDDAELSMGGWLLKQRDRLDTTHAICFTQLGYTQFPEAFASPGEVTAVRGAEVRLAAAMLGVHNVDLHLPDFDVRTREVTAEQFRVREEAASRLLRINLHRVIAETKPREIFAPAAIGNHPDHRLIFDIVVDLFDADRFPGTKIHFYEDVPYSSSYDAIDSFLARFETSYITVQPWVEEISSVLELKQTICEVYRSQAWPGRRDLIEAIAQRTAEFLEPLHEGIPVMRAAERFWTLTPNTLLVS